MIEILAQAYFEFFPGDFLVFGAIGTYVWWKRSKEDEDFYR